MSTIIVQIPSELPVATVARELKQFLHLRFEITDGNLIVASDGYNAYITPERIDVAQPAPIRFLKLVPETSTAA